MIPEFFLPLLSCVKILLHMFTTYNSSISSSRMFDLVTILVINMNTKCVTPLTPATIVVFISLAVFLHLLSSQPFTPEKHIQAEMELVETVEVVTMIRETPSYAKVLLGFAWLLAILVAIGFFASPIVFTWIHSYGVKTDTSLDRVTGTKLLSKLISGAR